MYFDFKVKIPEVKGKIYERTIKGVVYINYEYDRIYKPDKKYNIPKRTTIGKKCEDDPEMMYPNPNFLAFFPDTELPEDQGRDARSSCLRIGTWIVIEKLMRESLIERIISSLYGDERGQGCFWTWRHTILLQRIMLVSTIRNMLITTRFSRQSIGSTAIPQYRPSSARSLRKTVYLFRTNGMRSRKSRIRSIFHTILQRQRSSIRMKRTDTCTFITATVKP